MGGADAPTAGNGSTPDSLRTEPGQERPARNAGRGERSNRGDRNRNERPENSEQIGSAEQRPDQRNERRPDRNRRPEENSHAEPADAEAGISGATVDVERLVTAEGAPTRERRPRDRHGRDRGPRADRSDQSDRQERPEQTSPEGAVDEPRRSYFTTGNQTPALPVVAATTTEPEMPVVAPTVPPVADAVAAPKPAPEATSGMPKLRPFVLPLSELSEVAQSSGLIWVNSDAERIAAVQMAIAAEPKQIHVPRERPVPVRVDTGPLILVETKRDLRNLELPFETAQ
jgi:ribonuclease E